MIRRTSGVPSKVRKTEPGLMSRVKRLFRRPGGAGSQSRAPQPSQHGLIHRPDLSAVDFSTLSANSTSFLARNPNDTLAEFFRRKGDAPLSEVEVEGVMSLINRSVGPQEGSFSRGVSPSRSMVGGSRNTSIYNASNNSLLHGDSTVLRADSKQPVRIATPSYKPKSRVIRRPHVGRIVNYGGAPRKRTRLESPLVVYREKKKRELEKKEEGKSVRAYTGGMIDLTDLGTEDDDDVEMDDVDAPIVAKKISKTATRVLSIISTQTEETVKPIEVKKVLEVERPVKPVEVKEPVKVKEPVRHVEVKSVSRPISKPTPKPTPKPAQKPIEVIDLSSGSEEESEPEKAAPTLPKVSLFELATPAKVVKPIETPKPVQPVQPPKPVFSFHPQKPVFASQPKLVPSRETIDRFVFPDVSSTNQGLLAALNSSKSAAAPAKESIERFVFPTTGEADQSTLSSIDDSVVQLYDGVFGFGEA